MIPRRPLTGSLAVFHEIKTSCSSIKQVCCYYICFYLFIDLIKTLARVGRDRGGEVGGGGGLRVVSGFPHVTFSAHYLA